MSAADVVFVVDSSRVVCEGSQPTNDGCVNWGFMKTFMRNLVSSVAVGSNANQFGLVMYGSTAQVSWTLNRWVWLMGMDR